MEYEPVRHDTPKVPPRDDHWWRGAVIYQVYPRSFMDTNDDGVGDLKGVASRLDHIASLGVDAVWVSPFMKSPMKDFGYDVADYRAVDPLFGTLDDFDALLEKAHALGLKLMIDFVPSHTSNRHPWFLESREDGTNPKADWYVWADAKADGSPPSNWISVFGGSAWEWEPRRRQYYLHNFLKEQPDLNFHNDEVIAALMEQARFWLERGVDGFRIDAIDYGVHDPELRDNPPRPPGHLRGGGTPGSPWAMQYQQYNKARPQLADRFLKPIYRLSHEYEGRALLGEISGETALKRLAEYTSGGGLDIAYTFDLLLTPLTPQGIREVVEELEGHVGDGWACIAFSNHDVLRAVTRFGGDAAPPEAGAMLPMLLTSLRGTVCLYQGEELGLGQAEVAYEDLQDPVGRTFWPQDKGRDGCRTPMPWTGEGPGAGFTGGRPWLPVPDAHRRHAVALQEADPGSVLNRLRAFLRWRKDQAPLVLGTIRFEAAPAGVLAFTRTYEGREIYAAFNLDDAAAGYPAPFGLRDLGAPGVEGRIQGGTVTLPPHGVVFGESG
ncbi:MAG: alpha glucosidase [Geminicoccaceae bacterium]|nr:alpha glucosidase [Geminicoccaceae bacterium]